jgi:hypothetical protein
MLARPDDRGDLGLLLASGKALGRRMVGEAVQLIVGHCAQGMEAPVDSYRAGAPEPRAAALAFSADDQMARIRLAGQYSGQLTPSP